MGKFKGIKPEGLFLLAENRFNDSKIFYEEHKPQIRELVIEPLYDLINDLQPLLISLDGEMELTPYKMVSRVRRDNRYTNDKSMYRENMWVMFMRDKRRFDFCQPCMWFDFKPDHYNYGIGIFYCNAKMMTAFRETLDENGDEFLRALTKIKKIGIEPNFETYKKDRSYGKDKRLKEYYNAKELYFMSNDMPLEKLFDGSVEEELKNAITAFSPMYKFLLRVTEKVIKNKQGVNENG